MNEMKRILNALRGVGALLIAFPIYVYFFKPVGYGWFTMLPFGVVSITVGAVLVAISMIVWNSERKKNTENTKTQPVKMKNPPSLIQHL